MKNINILFVFVFIIMATSIKAQKNIDFTKTNFPDNKKGLKEAQKNISAGDKFFNIGIGKYPDAIEYYLKANGFNPDNAFLNYKIGKCYYYSLDMPKALQYFQTAHILLPNVEGDVLFYIAQSYQGMHEFETAILKLMSVRMVLNL